MTRAEAKAIIRDSILKESTQAAKLTDKELEEIVNEQVDAAVAEGYINIDGGDSQARRNARSADKSRLKKTRSTLNTKRRKKGAALIDTEETGYVAPSTKRNARSTDKSRLKKTRTALNTKRRSKKRATTPESTNPLQAIGDGIASAVTSVGQSLGIVGKKTSGGKKASADSKPPAAAKPKIKAAKKCKPDTHIKQEAYQDGRDSGLWGAIKELKSDIQKFSTQMSSKNPTSLRKKSGKATAKSRSKKTIPVMLHGSFSSRAAANERKAAVARKYPTRNVEVGTAANGKFYVKSKAK